MKKPGINEQRMVSLVTLLSGVRVMTQIITEAKPGVPLSKREILRYLWEAENILQGLVASLAPSKVTFPKTK